MSGIRFLKFSPKKHDFFYHCHHQILIFYIQFTTKQNFDFQKREIIIPNYFLNPLIVILFNIFFICFTSRLKSNSMMNFDPQYTFSAILTAESRFKIKIQHYINRYILTVYKYTIVFWNTFIILFLEKRIFKHNVNKQL